MFQQAKDLLEEGTELKKVLDGLSADDWQKETPFKSWTGNKVVQHLHGAGRAAVLSLTDAEGFQEAISDGKKIGGLMNPIAVCWIACATPRTRMAPRYLLSGWL